MLLNSVRFPNQIANGVSTRMLVAQADARATARPPCLKFSVMSEVNFGGAQMTRRTITPAGAIVASARFEEASLWHGDN